MKSSFAKQGRPVYDRPQVQPGERHVPRTPEERRHLGDRRDARRIARTQPCDPRRAGAGAGGIQGGGRLTGAVERHGIAAQREVFGLKTAYAAEFGKDKDRRSPSSPNTTRCPAIGHACGHNIIATAGFGAGDGAVETERDRLPGRVRYLGTPAEERYGGKELMARAGAFDGTDAAMMIHPSNLNLITMPCIAICDVTAVFHGRAAHASAVPYRGLNALDAVVTAYQSIAQLRQHIKNTDRIHGIITEGGLAATSCRSAPRAASMCAPSMQPSFCRSSNACMPASRRERSPPAAAPRSPGRDQLSRPQDQLADGGSL